MDKRGVQEAVMKIKLNGWQRIGVVLNAIYLIIIIFIAWELWPMPTKLLPNPNDIVILQPESRFVFEDESKVKQTREPRDLLQRQPIPTATPQANHKDIFDEIDLLYKKSLRIDRLKIVGFAFMAWIIPSGIVYLLGFSSKRILSIIKTLFKSIRTGIILIFVGIFIPTVVYPLTEPMKKVKDTVEYRIKISKGKEIHYKLNELELVLNAQQVAIPYKYFVVSGIVFVFIGTGICVLNKDKRTTITQKDNSNLK